MGYDCTLHLVDEASFPRFVARFLRGVRDTPNFDAAFDVDELITKVQALMTSEPPRGAKALGELALLFVSSETPHVYSRGFSLSLWDEETMGDEAPYSLMTTVEQHLRDVIAAYPACAGHVPDMFTENYMVGPFVPATHVPELLAYLNTTLDAMVPGDRKYYLPLRNLLRVAVERGLAYWEGTDIGVTQTHEEWLALPPPAGVTLAPSPFTGYVNLRGVSGSRMFMFESWRFHEVDTSTWPPTTQTREDAQVTIAAPTPWNSLLLRIATDRNVRPYKFVNIDEPSGRSIDVGYEPSEAQPTRDAVIVFPYKYMPRDKRKGLRPMVVRQDSITPLDVPDSTNENLDCYAQSFGDGTALVIWDARPYRWDGKTMTPLPGTLEAPEGPQAIVTMPDGSIAGCFGRRVIRIEPDGTQHVLAPITNAMAIALGPDETLVVTEGDHPESDVMKVLWTRTQEITHLEGELLGLEESPRLSYYDAPRAQLVVLAPTQWHALAWSHIAALPRVSRSDFTARREQLVEQSKT
ncbi:MAG TPA: hypothetical protein VGM39_08225 [Kofleriaceae bacterium]|jgi:hypothetical protein